MALERAVYRPRDAAHTVPHQIIAERREVFLRAVAAAGEGAGLPQFVERGFRELLTCGVFERAGARLRCEGCAREHVVPLSHKGQAWCPSCCGRWITERAALMHRAFGIDVLACRQCGGGLCLIATLHDPVVIRKTLALCHSGQSPGPAPPESGVSAPASAIAPATSGSEWRPCGPYTFVAKTVSTTLTIEGVQVAGRSTGYIGLDLVDLECVAPLGDHQRCR